MGRPFEWKLMLFVLTTGLVVSAAEVLPAYAADFTLGVSPTSATVQIGSSVGIGIAITSKGITGTINVGIRGVSPAFSKGLTYTQTRYDIYISKTSPTGTAFITFSAAKGAAATTYTITISGKDITGGCCYGLTHNATLTLTVA
jgi:hypothetical protein